MWGKSKINPNDTLNMCNQFLIIHLINKIKISEARGGSQYTSVYRNAISSIKRYPLPIICRLQLESVHGIGDSLCQDLEKVIKKHYTYYLDSNLGQKFSKQSQNNQIISQSSQNYLSRKDEILEKKNINLQKDENDSRSVKSMSVQYKPRINTANAYFLQVLRKQSKNNINEHILKQIIKEQVELKYNVSKNKSWKLIQSTLQQNGYIIITKNKNSQGRQQTTYQLTQKGECYVENMQTKTRANESKSKILNEVKIFKNTISQSQMLKAPQIQIDDEIEKPLKILQLKKGFDLSKFQLVIDNRQKNDKNETNFFMEKITEKYQINCRTLNLTLGDFVWIYDNKVLDYIVQRKKADDLASSIIDGRYKDQKYRLKSCGVSNIFYLYEGYPSDTCSVAEKQLSNALLKTRVRQKFKVYKTKDVNETMRFLYEIHQQIQSAIIQGKMKYLCTLQQFNEYNSVHRNSSIEKMFALGLMTIPGVGKNAITKFLSYFKTYRCLHDHLKIKFTNNEDKIAFLKELFKGSGIITSLPKVIVGLLFEQTYQNNELINENSSSQSSKKDLNEPKKLEFNRQKRFSIIRQENQYCEEQYNV